MLLDPPDCFNCHCKECFILKNNNKKWLTQINTQKKYFRCMQGKSLIREGMELNEIYFIFKGKIKLESTGLYGKKQIKRLAKTGDIVGFRGLTESNTFPASVYALEDTYVCSISKELFLNALKSNSELLYETMMLSLRELLRIEERMKNLTTMNVREKVAESLLYIYTVFGTLSSGELDVVLSRQEIAEIAMTTKGQVSKCLSEFEEEGKIRMKGKKIFITKLNDLKRMTED